MRLVVAFVSSFLATSVSVWGVITQLQVLEEMGALRPRAAYATPAPPAPILIGSGERAGGELKVSEILERALAQLPPVGVGKGAREGDETSPLEDLLARWKEERARTVRPKEVEAKGEGKATAEAERRGRGESRGASAVVRTGETPERRVVEVAIPSRLRTDSGSAAPSSPAGRKEDGNRGGGVPSRVDVLLSSQTPRGRGVRALVGGEVVEASPGRIVVRSERSGKLYVYEGVLQPVVSPGDRVRPGEVIARGVAEVSVR